ncbi:sulfite exporter TauE/SafE family protein [Devosia sp.]|uniref:sulfite exporter TauE/SafE family protein n=1 Tax=Devosia sp. TaxID=1871048 RepID=UPI0035AF2D54
MPEGDMMDFSVAALASGTLVGFVLGLVGGGGSILATPLLLYVVGVASPHVAIGTGALAVAASASLNVAGYVRRGLVRWRPALSFAGLGVVGALAGSSLGKLVDGDQLLLAFGLLMAAVGVLMLRPRPVARQADAASPRPQWLLPVLAVLSGLASGFFGIGGGFLIVPALGLATGMPLIEAIAASLVSVTAFGLATSANYALSGLIDWPIAGQFIVGGFVGGLGGTWLATYLSRFRRVLNLILAGVILAAAGYVTYRAAYL